mmetsp:Transcript_6654/g.19702  ORF Transcript_6654/g.19702 Transcript_6654/m.19702 type:complete len:229 (+) Transcript_6654:5358-6044(+)
MVSSEAFFSASSFCFFLALFLALFFTLFATCGAGVAGNSFIVSFSVVVRLPSVAGCSSSLVSSWEESANNFLRFFLADFLALFGAAIGAAVSSPPFSSSLSFLAGALPSALALRGVQHFALASAMAVASKFVGEESKGSFKDEPSYLLSAAGASVSINSFLASRASSSSGSSFSATSSSEERGGFFSDFFSDFLVLCLAVLDFLALFWTLFRFSLFPSDSALACSSDS